MTTVTFVRALPSSDAALSVAERMAAECDGLPVLVMEDSNHAKSSVESNLASYRRFVTPGSYMIVQDTRGGRFTGVADAISEFLSTHGVAAARANTPHAVTQSAHRAAALASAVFVRDRRPEYLLFSQHTGGFLRRLLPAEEPGSHDELV